MISPDKSSGSGKDAVRRNPPRVAFTLVEMIVTLAVACILMIAVVAFLVNGVISTTKTTAINDTTTKGRYVFEHMSKEMARSSDLNVVSPTPQGNFFGPNPGYVYPRPRRRAIPAWDTRVSTTAFLSADRPPIPRPSPSRMARARASS